MKRNGTSTAFTLAGFLLMLFIWTGCEKDKFETGHDLKAKIYSPISVTEAQNYFRSLDLAVVNTLDGDHKFLNINPVWDSAFVSHAQSGREIVIVPIADSVLLQANEGRANAKLIFSKKGTDSILVNILLYCADSAYYAATNGNINFNTFSGVYSFFDIGQNFKYAVYVKDGVPKSGTDTLHHSTSQSIEDRACYTYVIYYYLCPPAQTVLLEADCWHFISFHWCDNFGDPGSGNGGSGNGGNGGNGGSGGGNGGGGGGNNNNTPVNIFDEEVGFLEVFTDAIPLDVFLEKGGKLPAGGINAAKARQLVEINDLLDLPIEQIKWLSTHGSLIPTIRNNINNPELRVQMKQLLELAIQLNLTEIQAAWLLAHPAIITEISTFLSTHSPDANKANVAKAVSLSYISMMMENDPVINQMMDDIKDQSVGDPIWDFLIEQLGAVIKDALIDLIPGGTLVTVGPQAIQQFKDGDWLGGLWTVATIALDEAQIFIGPLKVWNTGLKLAQNAGKLSKFYEVMKKVYALGDDVAYKVYQVLRNKLDKLYSKIKWGGNTVGAEVTGTSPLEIWDDLVSAFGANIDPNQPNPNEITATFTIGQRSYSMKIYLNSSTTGGPTIAIAKEPNGPTFKMRF